MNSDKNGSFYSDSSQEEDFWFGMEPYDDFESDSDGEADNVVVEVDVRDLQDVNEYFWLKWLGWKWMMITLHRMKTL